MRKPNYRLTGTADSALDELFRRGATEFGITKAQDYLLGLHETFEMLARFPEAGRPFHEFRRHEHASHIIFYTIEDGAIVLVDVIGAGQDVERWRRKR